MKIRFRSGNRYPAILGDRSVDCTVIMRTETRSSDTNVTVLFIQNHVVHGFLNYNDLLERVQIDMRGNSRADKAPAGAYIGNCPDYDAFWEKPVLAR